ncbi:ABC transporter ATP-binding protein [Clostridiales bacterium COT073_COT-073]|nr:ABC transporter ATP-binding protein [Clostridiales bacterium COT073_COT-073]
MKRVIKEMGKLWPYYLLGSIALIVSLILNFYNPVVLQRMIDEVIKEGQIDQFRTLGMLMLLLTFGRALTGYFKELLFDLGGLNLAVSIRQQLFDHIQSLSYDFFDEKNTGELMSRVKEDVDNVWMGTSFGLFLTVEMLLTMGTAVTLMFRIHPGLTLMIVPVLPVLAYLTIRLNLTNVKVFEDISEQTATMNTTAGEDIAGIRMVKSFAREKHEIEKFLKNNQEYYRLNYNQAKVLARFYPTIEFIMNVLPVILIVAGGAYVIQAKLSIGVLAEFSAYASMAMWPMRMTGWIATLMAQAGSSAKKIDQIFACQSKIENKENGIKSGKIKGNIRFDGVSLELDNMTLLKNVSFEVKPGKTLAIMGSTGSGKSLITKLLARFYDASAGTIYLDEIPIKDYDLFFLRKQFSFVLQNVFLFSESIAENISLGQGKTLAPDDLERFAEDAMAHQFISQMEKSYDTVIGEKGIGLSGGQKQRISIARAFARKSPVLILDDSTSALDMETESSIQKNIEHYGEITKIIVAHRISAVKNADEILVIEGGQIVERGKHEELLALKGHYYETYQEQMEFLVA